MTLSPFVLPELRRGFEQTNPQVSVSQVEANQADLFAKLSRAEIDAAITYDLELPPDLFFEPLVELPPYALFKPDHPMANRRSVSLEALSGLPLVLLDLPVSGKHRPMVLGLATVRSERKSRVPAEFEKHCRNSIHARHVPGMAVLKSRKTGVK